VTDLLLCNQCHGNVNISNLATKLPGGFLIVFVVMYYYFPLLGFTISVLITHFACSGFTNCKLVNSIVCGWCWPDQQFLVLCTDVAQQD